MQTDRRQKLSRARQALRKHHERISVLLNIFLAPHPLIKGTVYELRRRCGKPTCRCARGELHATMVISSSEQGRTRLRSIPHGQLAELRIQTKRYQTFRAARAEVVALLREMVALMNELEALRTKQVER